jgi:hypothetical protein
MAGLVDGLMSADHGGSCQELKASELIAAITGHNAFSTSLSYVSYGAAR